MHTYATLSRYILGLKIVYVLNYLLACGQEYW